MEIIAFSSTPSPFPPARMSKIPLSVLIQAALDIRRNKAKEEDEKGVMEGVGTRRRREGAGGR